MLQGMAPWLVGRVRRLHISTHSRRIHSDILRWLQLAGWPILAQFTFLLFGRNLHGGLLSGLCLCARGPKSWKHKVIPT